MQKNSVPLFLALLFTITAFSQSGLNSIYSAYGIGDVQVRDYNGYGGMGGLGVALPSVTTLNDLNPASYAYLPSNRLMLELSFGGKSVNYTNSTQNISAGDFTIQKAAMGLSLFKNLGTSFGIKRYSSVDYLTSGNLYVIGTDSKLSSEIEGNGGLYQFYLSNGLKIGKNLSVGLTTGLLAGSVNRRENILTSASDGISIEKNLYYSEFVLNGGLQYAFKAGGLKWIAGGTYQPQRSLSRLEDNAIKDLSGNTIISEDGIHSRFEFPAKWSAGLTMVRKYWKFGADYIGQQWSGLHYKGTGFTTTNAANYALGVSYSKPRKTLWGTIDGPTVSAGFVRDQSYLVVDGAQVNTTAGTLGVSLPSASGFYHYHFSFKAGSRGKAVYPLVKERFVEFNFNVSLASFIYKGGRKYD